MICDTEAELKRKCNFIIKSKKYGDIITFIDTEDYDKVCKYKWCLSITDGRMYIRGFSRYGKNQKKISLHRFIMNDPKGYDIDHINHNILDNRKSNLRVCTRSENLRNSLKHKDSQSSKYKGVYFCNTYKKYISKICVNGVRHHVGSFNNQHDAALAYNKKAIELHGEFALLNEVEYGD